PVGAVGNNLVHNSLVAAGIVKAFDAPALNKLAATRHGFGGLNIAGGYEVVVDHDHLRWVVESRHLRPHSVDEVHIEHNRRVDFDGDEIADADGVKLCAPGEDLFSNSQAHALLLVGSG